MTALAESGRDYWRGVLDAGGFTALPRWVREPRPGVAECSLAIPGVDRSALLAVHTKVLAALTGEVEVVTGVVVDGVALPCRLSVEPGSWRGLLDEVAAVEARLREHAAAAPEEARSEGLFDTVFDPAGDFGEDGLPEGVVLGVGARESGDGFELRLRYRTDVLDADAAARVAGYYRAAAGLIAADPDADHQAQTLLGVEELRLQLVGMAGPSRELPGVRAHQLFEQRVRLHPDEVAAVHAGHELTYAEVNARANRVARALHAAGIGREDVVAVVTERNLDWLVAVLAVFKAGGVYLPIEPHFPAERIAKTLRRADCALALTEPDSTQTLDAALAQLPGVPTLFVTDAYHQDHPDTNLDVEIAAGQLAYIYFTSGSTGEPKGAMCEHAGMLNHLFAKIDDLDITHGSVVAQIAPQCFDISLWQLIAPLLVGGRTLLIEQDVILDAARFVDTLRRHKVAVAQVVPSYLDVVLTYLEANPTALPELRYISATGEALKAELAERWFTAQPGVGLVNAYGLTETSDDTNHEILRTAPADGRIPLGPPVNNVTVYVVDEHLSPVPLGAPGLIAFSGVCVGRGYINDPDRTAECYLTDPHHPGQRLYLGGDYGRWRPDGKLEFLGRRDGQVKIAGFRIEIGEIENALLRVPGVNDGAVVITHNPDRGKRLVAFYTGPHPLPDHEPGKHLAETLPHYMVPTAFHWMHTLPLTANGKINKKALTAQAAELATTEPTGHTNSGGNRPETPTQQRIADAWATLLGVPAEQIGPHTDFFELGGTSLTSVKLAIALDRQVSLRDITQHPVLAQLAELIDTRNQPNQDPMTSVITESR